jgi:hypothetical protein
MSLEVDRTLIWGYNTYMNTKEHNMDYEDDEYYTVTGCDPEEYEYEDDGQPDEAQEWADFDPEC